jgi:hypothetical protein
VYSVKKKSYAKTRNGSVKRLIRGDDEVHAMPFALLASWGFLLRKGNARSVTEYVCASRSSWAEKVKRRRARRRSADQQTGVPRRTCSGFQRARAAETVHRHDRRPASNGAGWPGDFRVCMLAVVRCTMDGWAPTHQSGDEEEDDAHHVCVAVLF